MGGIGEVGFGGAWKRPKPRLRETTKTLNSKPLLKGLGGRWGGVFGGTWRRELGGAGEFLPLSPNH